MGLAHRIVVLTTGFILVLIPATQLEPSTHGDNTETRSIRLEPRSAVGELGSTHEPIHSYPAAVAGIDVSLTPEITIRNGTADQHRRLDEALARFASAGLLLPNLGVEFWDDVSVCGGHYGLFRTGRSPWRIQICSELDAVYEHELAHAWELANLADETRREFMTLRGHATWADKNVPWNERAIEGVALVIQQGLGGLPLPPHISGEHRSRLQAFQLLTGLQSPQVLEWCARPDRDQDQAREICRATVSHKSLRQFR